MSSSVFSLGLITLSGLLVLFVMVPMHSVRCSTSPLTSTLLVHNTATSSSSSPFTYSFIPERSSQYDYSIPSFEETLSSLSLDFATVELHFETVSQSTPGYREESNESVIQSLRQQAVLENQAYVLESQQCKSVNNECVSLRIELSELENKLINCEQQVVQNTENNLSEQRIAERSAIKLREQLKQESKKVKRFITNGNRKDNITENFRSRLTDSEVESEKLRKDLAKALGRLSNVESRVCNLQKRYEQKCLYTLELKETMRQADVEDQLMTKKYDTLVDQYNQLMDQIEKFRWTCHEC